MNWSEMQTSWPELKSLVQAHWPKLSEKVLDDIGGDRSALTRAIECHYGCSAADAEGAICDFEKDVRRPGAVK
jgi:hypothetical protein